MSTSVCWHMYQFGLFGATDKHERWIRDSVPEYWRRWFTYCDSLINIRERKAQLENTQTEEFTDIQLCHGAILPPLCLAMR